jgi:hypothetical protein
MPHPRQFTPEQVELIAAYNRLGRQAAAARQSAVEIHRHPHATDQERKDATLHAIEIERSYCLARLEMWRAGV